MVRPHGHVLGECGVVGDDGAGIAHRTEILAGIERNPLTRFMKSVRAEKQHVQPRAEISVEGLER